MRFFHAATAATLVVGLGQIALGYYGIGPTEQNAICIRCPCQARNVRCVHQRGLIFGRYLGICVHFVVGQRVRSSFSQHASEEPGFEDKTELYQPELDCARELFALCFARAIIMCARAFFAVVSRH